MWLLNARTHVIELFYGKHVPRYAILSHRWEDDEVSFKDILKRRHLQRKGWNKVKLCCEQAISDGLSHVWVDTCCIDKKSSSELTEAINSMYCWYKEAAVCYAFLSDVVVSVPSETSAQDLVEEGIRKPKTDLEASIADSLWFTRGWTLQELLAPQRLEFYGLYWNHLGSKADRWFDIRERTSIPREALENFTPGAYSVAQKMSWAAGRSTTRVEDRAYSLLGIFNIHMPLVYGEGNNAFIRLQEEIMRGSADTSIFAWSGVPDAICGMLTISPDSYEKIKQIENFTPWTSSFARINIGINGEFMGWEYMDDLYVACLGWSSNSIKPVDTSSVEAMWESLAENQITVVGMYLASTDGSKHTRASLNGEYLFVGKLDRSDIYVDVIDANIAQAPIVDVKSSLDIATDHPDIEASLKDWSVISIKPGIFQVEGMMVEVETQLQNIYDNTSSFMLQDNGSVHCPCLIVSDSTKKNSRPIVLLLKMDADCTPTTLLLDSVQGAHCPRRLESRGPHICTLHGCATQPLEQDLSVASREAFLQQNMKQQSYLRVGSPAAKVLSAAEIRATAATTIELPQFVTIYVTNQDGLHRVWFDFTSEVRGVDVVPTSWLMPAASNEETSIVKDIDLSARNIHRECTIFQEQGSSMDIVKTNSTVLELVNSSDPGPISLVVPDKPLLQQTDISESNLVLSTPLPATPGVPHSTNNALVLPSLHTVEDFTSTHYDGNPHINDEYGIDNEHLRWLAPRSLPVNDNVLSDDYDLDAVLLDDTLPPYTIPVTNLCNVTARDMDVLASGDSFMKCPVCQTTQMANNILFNEHVDVCLNKELISTAAADDAALALTRWLEYLDAEQPHGDVDFRIAVVDNQLACTPAGLLGVYDQLPSYNSVQAENNLWPRDTPNVASQADTSLLVSNAQDGSPTATEQSTLPELVTPLMIRPKPGRLMITKSGGNQCSLQQATTSEGSRPQTPELLTDLTENAEVVPNDNLAEDIVMLLRQLELMNNTEHTSNASSSISPITPPGSDENVPLRRRNRTRRSWSGRVSCGIHSPSDFIGLDRPSIPDRSDVVDIRDESNAADFGTSAISAYQRETSLRKTRSLPLRV